MEKSTSARHAALAQFVFGERHCSLNIKYSNWFHKLQAVGDALSRKLNKKSVLNLFSNLPKATMFRVSSVIIRVRACWKNNCGGTEYLLEYLSAC